MVLKDKVAVVTGGAGNIGLAAARAFVAEGAKVMLVDIDEAAVKKAANSLGADQNVATCIADVTRAADVEGYAKAAAERFGPIDIFFNNAGIEGPVAHITQFPDDAFDRVMAVNVRGVYLGMKHMLPRMKDGGSVIITSSIAGFRGTADFVAYGCSKHAVIGIMKSTALDAAPRKIRVNTLHPGMIESDMLHRLEKKFTPDDPMKTRRMLEGGTKLGRYITPDEVAELVVFLASDHSKMITGSEFVIDGGFLL